MPPPNGADELPAAGVRLMLRHLMLTGWAAPAVAAGTGLPVSRIRYLRKATAKTVTRAEGRLISRFYVDHYGEIGPNPRAIEAAASEGYLDMWRVAPLLVPAAFRPAPPLTALAIYHIEERIRIWLAEIKRTPYWRLLSTRQDFYLTHRFGLLLAQEGAVAFFGSIRLQTASAFSSSTGLTSHRVGQLTSIAILTLLADPQLPVDGIADDLRSYLVTLAVA